MGSKTVYRLVIRHRPTAPAQPVDTVLTQHDEPGLAIAAFDLAVRRAGGLVGPWAQHQLLLLPEQVKR